MRWSGLLPSSSRDGSHCTSIMSYSIHEPERLEQSDQRIPPISTLSERVRNPQKQKRSSVLWSRKRPMSLQGVWVRGDAKFPLSQCLRSSSQLKWERRETSHRCFRVWFKNHTDVCNRAIATHSILLGLFCRCWSALETLCAGSASAEGKGLERCADSLPACSPGMSEGTQHTVNQRHSAASVAAILSVLLCLCSSVVGFEYFTGSSEWHSLRHS